MTSVLMVLAATLLLGVVYSLALGKKLSIHSAVFALGNSLAPLLAAWSDLFLPVADRTRALDMVLVVVSMIWGLRFAFARKWL